MSGATGSSSVSPEARLKPTEKPAHNMEPTHGTNRVLTIVKIKVKHRMQDIARTQEWTPRLDSPPMLTSMLAFNWRSTSSGLTDLELASHPCRPENLRHQRWLARVSGLVHTQRPCRAGESQ
jgi:hypothetical protein